MEIVILIAAMVIFSVPLALLLWPRKSAEPAPVRKPRKPRKPKTPPSDPTLPSAPAV